MSTEVVGKRNPENPRRSSDAGKARKMQDNGCAP